MFSPRHDNAWLSTVPNFQLHPISCTTDCVTKNTWAHAASSDRCSVKGEKVTRNRCMGASASQIRVPLRTIYLSSDCFMFPSCEYLCILVVIVPKRKKMQCLKLVYKHTWKILIFHSNSACAVFVFFVLILCVQTFLFCTRSSKTSVLLFVLCVVNSLLHYCV